MTHGTRYAYNKGKCRCDECKEWHRQRNLEQKRRNPATTIARQARYKTRTNEKSREAASRRGEPWTETDLEVAARDDLTSEQVAAELGRTFFAAENMRQAARSQAGQAATG